MATKAEILAAAKRIVAAAKSPVKRKANPAKRIGTKKPLRTSQATGAAPTKRLVKRRKANKQEGYFPNPTAVAKAHKGTGTGADIMPFCITTENNKPLGYFPSQVMAVKFAESYAKANKTVVKVMKV